MTILRGIPTHVVALAMAIPLFACAGGDEEVLELDLASSELRRGEKELIQAGSEQVLLAVTEDDHAVYQEGPVVYATRLARGARRVKVADVPDGNIAFTLQVGKVVFVWTNPQRNRPGFGVSPLVLYTADGGPQLISAQSSIGLVATGASDDSRQILFTTRASDDGQTGDLVLAETRRPLEQTVLLAGTTLGFPNAPCRPLAGFGGGRGHDTYVVAQHCFPGETSATMSIFRRGVRRDLIAGIALPLPFFFDSDPELRTFLVSLANGDLDEVSVSGRIRRVDTVAPTRGFVADDGTLGYRAPLAGGGAELRLARRGRLPAAAVAGAIAGFVVEPFDRQGYWKRSPLSPDSSKAIFRTVTDPATGLIDFNLLDVKTGRTFVLNGTPDTAATSEIWTADSDHAVFIRAVDVNTGSGPLFAGNERGVRQIGDSDNVFDAIRAYGSVISYLDDVIFDPGQLFFASSADLYVADADDPDAAPRLVGIRAGINYFASHDGRKVAFTSEAEDDGPGLYSASARP
jgi:hypothetical protein